MNLSTAPSHSAGRSITSDWFVISFMYNYTTLFDKNVILKPVSSFSDIAKCFKTDKLNVIGNSGDCRNNVIMHHVRSMHVYNEYQATEECHSRPLIHLPLSIKIDPS